MTAVRQILAAALVLAGLTGGAAAQSAIDAEAKPYPSRAIRIIVPFPPGGPADIVTRFVGQRMSEDFGQPVVIENRPGGNTAIGAQVAARAAPDGYTLFVPMDTTLVMNPLVTPNLPYDPQKDFAPITLLTKNMSLVVTRREGPKTIAELISTAKASPGKLNMGAGTITSRLGALLFAKTAGIDVQLVPFKGSAEIGQAVLAGTVDFALDSTARACRSFKAGTIARWRNTQTGRCPSCLICRHSAWRPACPAWTKARPGWGSLRPPARRAPSSTRSSARSRRSTPIRP